MSCSSFKPRPRAVCRSLRGLTRWAAISWRLNPQPSALPHPPTLPPGAGCDRLSAFPAPSLPIRPAACRPLRLSQSWPRRASLTDSIRSSALQSCLVDVMVVKTHWLGSWLVVWLRRKRLQVSSCEAIFSAFWTHSCLFCRPPPPSLSLSVSLSLSPPIPSITVCIQISEQRARDEANS